MCDCEPRSEVRRDAIDAIKSVRFSIVIAEQCVVSVYTNLQRKAPAFTFMVRKTCTAVSPCKVTKITKLRLRTFSGRDAS